jgi:hypothetical protein
MALVERSVPAEKTPVEEIILTARGERVILDHDLARLYGVTTKALNQAVRRNLERFPSDFVFRLNYQEVAGLRSQSVTSNATADRSQSVTSLRGGRRSLPYAFTEHGALMAASVLRSPRAVEMSLFVVRAFVRLRRSLAQHADLARKLEALEKKYDAQFKVVFEAIRALMAEPEPRRRAIGFRVEDRRPAYRTRRSRGRAGTNA